MAYANGVTINSGTVEVDGLLTLSSGLLTNSGTFTLNTNATTNISTSSGKATSYVVGTMNKIIEGNANKGFFFPIGTATLYKPAGVSNVTGTNHSWSIIY